MGERFYWKFLKRYYATQRVQIISYLKVTDSPLKILLQCAIGLTICAHQPSGDAFIAEDSLH